MKIWNASSRIALFFKAVVLFRMALEATGSQQHRYTWGRGQTSKTEIRFFPCLFLLQLHLLWIFPKHILGHLEHLRLSPRDGEIWQQWYPAQSLATPKAGCRTRGFARQGTLGKELVEEFVTASVRALQPNSIQCTLKKLHLPWNQLQVQTSQDSSPL